MNIILIFLLLFLKTLLPSIEPNNKQSDNYTLSFQQISKFQEDINQKGAGSVYQEIKNNLKNLDFTTKHDIAHLFGKALYKTKGTAGIIVCDSSFSFGCHHGLFTEAIQAEGINVVSKLNTSCKKAGQNEYDICQHGIGHGLVEYYGRNHLPFALEQCKKIQNNLLLGCSSGVFMDYFFPSELGQRNSSSLKIDPEDPFKICKTIDSQFINSCIFELPGLWRKTEDNISKLAARCSTFGDPSNQKFCLRGLGYATGDTRNPNPNFSLSKCKEIADNQAQLYCLSGASWFYYSTDQPQTILNTADTLCNNSSDEDMCYKLSNLLLEKFPE